jgi:hypothetical protein
MAAELTASIDLFLDQIGLFHSEEAGAGLASNRMREAVVRPVTRLWILRASATRFAALDRTFGQGAAAHGLGIG